MVGGEKIGQELVTKWAARVKLVLVYASTETNLVLLQTIQPGSDSEIMFKAVGCRVWITAPGDADRLVDVETVGELAIESWTLARGYLHDAEKTSAKFGHNPQWLKDMRSDHTTRLFLTGDKARFNTDGSVRVLGRQDDVIKLRGQKVDPNEVENAIRQHLSQRCHTAVIPSADGERLLAFLALNEESRGTRGQEVHVVKSDLADSLVATIEGGLATRLPAYLIPSTFLVLNQFPLTASGKLDRRRMLRMSSDSIFDRVATKRQPLSAQEITMCQLWSSVLKIPKSQIGLDDEFFQLGGHSLAAIRLVSEARKMKVLLHVKLIFEHPTLEALSACSVSVLDNDLPKVEPFELVGGLGSPLVQELMDEISAQCKIEKRRIEDIYPCSPLQSGMMALTMKEPGAYVARCILPLSASTDESRLCEAWRAAHAQCPILRTRIVETAIGTLQVVLHEEFSWSKFEIGLDAFLAQDRRQYIVLGDELSRLAIVDAGSNDRHVVWTVHHAIIDDWSIKPLLSIVSNLYSGIPTEPLPDFNSYIRHLLQVDREAEAHYWESDLEECPVPGYPALPSSTYTPQPSASVKKVLPFPLKPFSAVTSATVIRAAWALLLAHYSNTDDVVFGATLSGRSVDLPQIEQILGPTICTVPVRVRIHENMTVSSFLRNVQRKSADMTAFEQIGLQNIRRLSPQLRIACDFQTHLIIQSSESPDPANMLGCDAQIDDWKASASYSINLECKLVGSSVICDVVFDRRVVAEEQMDLLLGHFGRLLDQLCAQNDVRLQDLEIITDMDIQTIFQRNSRLPDSVEACAHDLIRDQSLKHPSHEAVCSWDGTLTYGELETYSNAIASQLVSGGFVSAGDIIPIFTEKSMWAVVSMLAIWKAGCAWTLLDVDHPDTWVNRILEDAQSKVVVCTEGSASHLPEAVGRMVVNRKMVEQRPNLTEVESWRKSSPRSIAFFLYTSGSTGKPKAIPHEHGAYLSGVTARMPILKRDQSSRVLQFSSYAFDTAIEDTITTLLIGGTVCIPSEHDRNNNLVAYMNSMHITHADFTPSFASIMSTEHPPSLKVLTLSGEIVTLSHRDTWAHRLALINSYGPSEVAIVSHTSRIEPDSHPSNVGTSVGCLDWIVRADNLDSLQAIGIVGELLLEGPILSRGYLNNEEKTQESFIANPAWLPVSEFGTRRLYRTGDLARYAPDGSVEIIGRKDSRMRKLRGQRIEVSQVETYVKESIPSAIDVLADVVALFDRAHSESLVVFVAFGNAYSEEEEQLSAWCAAIDRHLRNSLPAYMVPMAMVPLKFFPLTVHGKTDKKSILHLAEHLGKSGVRYIAPMSQISSADKTVSTSAERYLRDLWADTLDIAPDSLGSSDNFIHLGGDSIFAMKMVALANRKGDAGSLTVESVLRNPVLSDMALAMSTKKTNVVIGPVYPFQLLDVGLDGLAPVISQFASLCSCEADAIEDGYPCTPLQQGLMALSIKCPGTYVSQQVFELPAWVDVDRFRDAWDIVNESTAILRTRIIQSNAGAFQVVTKGSIDWLESKSLDQYLQEDQRTSMGLGSSLARYAIVQNDRARHFVWTMHHAIYDGWCISLVLDSVSRAYNGVFTRPKVEYNQFVQHLQVMERDGPPTFWEHFLSGVTESAIFPKLPSPAHSVRADASLDYSISLPKNRPKDVTLTTILYAAWGALVSEYLESADVVFGTTRTGRSVPLADIDQMVGPTFTTVPFRMTVDKTKPVHDLLLRVQRQITELLAYENLGLHSIKAVSDDAATACKFQTLVVIQPKEDEHLASADLGLFASPTVSGDISDFNPYSIMIQLKPSQDTVAVNSSFDSLVIDAAQMQRMLYQMEHLMHELCRCDQTSKLADINLLTRQDNNEILAWNNNGVAPDGELSCIHEVIEKQANLHPEAPAVCVWDGKSQSTMSYRELNEQSTRLSWELIRQGVRTETIVPICIEKSFFAAVALVAVLKAGGAFVLLDPAHPRDRLLSVIRQTGAQMVVVSEFSARLFAAEGSGLKILSESCLLRLATCTPDTQVSKPNAVSPSNLAALVFTSGSTGTPKGIQLEHSAICTSVLRGHGPALNLTRASRVFQFASFAFDMAIYDICGTLMMGGCVCMPTETSRLNNLATSINALQANWAFFTPSTVKLFTPEQVPCLQTLVVGGEAVKQETVDTWVNRVKLFQCSGPAETTTCVTYAMEPTTNKNRLGKGVGALCWVVSQEDYNVLAPIGTVGELVIEGATVARGYVADEHNALGSFISTPKWARDSHLGKKSTRRFYRCGDLVQYNSDGSLNFIGRKDAQIKVRGQRIELAEVEECMRQNAGNDVAVEIILSPNDQRTAILVAFVPTDTPERQISPLSECCVISQPPDIFYAEISHLQAHASSSLPPYMVPSFYIPVSFIPLNSSGKVDRKMLKTLGWQLSVQSLALFSSPDQRLLPIETPIEKVMQKLWAQVLRLDAETIGANSNILHLGGDSISAMQLVTLATEHGLHLTVADIFRNPVLDKLCRSVTALDVPIVRTLHPFELLGNTHGVQNVRREIAENLNIEQDLIEDAYPCTALQEGLMLSSIQNAGAYIAQEVYALPQDVDIEKFKLACESIYASHSVMRSCVTQMESLGCINVVLRGPLHWGHGEDIDEYLQEDRGNPIGFGSVLSRWAIVGSKTKFFLWTRHHAAYDGYSLQIAVDTIDAAYNAKGPLPLTPGPSISFRDLIQYLTEGDTAASIDYWERVLGNATPAAAWVSTGGTATPGIIQGAELQVSLPPRTGSSITLSTCIRAAWSLLVQKYSGSGHVVFGETLSGRNIPVPGIDHCPGPTFATVPVCIQVSSSLEVSEFLQEIQDQFIEMIPHQHYGLQKIMQINRQIRAACQYESLLVIQPEPFVNGNSVLRPLREGGHSLFYTNALTLTCQLFEEGLHASLHYDQSVLGDEQARRILTQFEHVLKQLASIVALPRLSDIDYVSPSDHLEICQWNENPPPVIYQCIHDVIADTARASPNTIAIDAWDGTFTYAELDETANQLAEYLMRLGISAGSLIPLIFPKSSWFIISILAVLKAGGGFVGIAHEDPQKRVEAILSNCQPKLVLTSPDCAHLAASTDSQVVVVTAGLVASFVGRAKTVNAGSVSPDDTSCVVYTSGSTGVPKGIILQHSLVCTNARVHAPALSISPSTRVLQFANHCWDAIFIEVIYPLMYGACICVPPNEMRMDSLVEVINESRANWMFLTPTTASLLEPRDVPTLNTLVIGGEAASENVLRTWQAIQGNLYNIYGPAECGVFAVFNKDHKLSAKPSEVGSRITGRLWLCDPEDHNKLVPIGCVGELLVEGHLSRGYLNEPERTAASFLNTTSWLERIAGARDGSSVYKTGDLLRYRENGTLEIIGRKDFQFKVNGQRMDSAEVEHHIIAHLGSTTHVIVDRISNPRQPASKLIAAFIDVSSASQAEPRNVAMDEDLRHTFMHLQDSLSAALPRFMVPSLYIPMSRLPVTATGKLDRNALRTLCAGFSDLEFDSYRLLQEAKELPVTPSEVRLQKLWSFILKTPVECIGRHDKFFSLGGDSITTMKLVSLARREGIALDVAAVFRKPRLLDMALALGSSVGHAEEDRLSSYTPFSLVKGDSSLNQSVVASHIPYPTTDITDIYPSTSFQSQSVADTLLKSRGMMSYFSFDGSGEVDLDRLKDSCFKLVQAHDVLRTIFVQSRGELIQVVLKRVDFRFEIFETSQPRLGTVSSRVIHQDSFKPLRLGDIFVAFFMIKSRSSAQFRLTIRMCHAQYDGLSLPHLWATLQDAYRGDPVLSVAPYSDYMCEYIRQRNDSRSRKYWRNLLQGAAITEIVSRSKPRYRKRSNATVTVTRHATAQPLALDGITLATVVKAAWTLVLAELSSTTDVVFLSTVSGRNSSRFHDAGSIVGACLNVIPIRISLQNGWSGARLLRHLQDQHTASIEFDLLGLHHILTQCTSWPRWGHAGSLVQHDGDGVTVEGHTIQLGQTELLASSEGTPGNSAEVAIHSRMEDGKLSVQVTALAPEIDEGMAAFIADRICRYASDLTAHPDRSALEFCNNGKGSQDHRLPLGESLPPPVQGTAPDVDLTTPPLTPDGPHAHVYRMLEKMWRDVLGRRTIDVSKSFFDQGGDMVGVCCLTDTLQSEGYGVSMEDLVDRAHFHEQLLLLLSL